MIGINPFDVLRLAKELINTIAEGVGLYQKLDGLSDRHLVQTLGALKEDVRGTAAKLCSKLDTLNAEYARMGIDTARPLKFIYADYVSKMRALERYRYHRLEKEFLSVREELTAVVDAFASILICADQQYLLADAHNEAVKYRQLLGPIGTNGDESLADAIRATYEVANDVRNQL